jgi:hypothetical protein
MTDVTGCFLQPSENNSNEAVKKNKNTFFTFIFSFDCLISNFK